MLAVRTSGRQVMDIGSLLEAIGNLGLRQARNAPDVYPSAPKGHKHQETRGRGGRRRDQPDEAIRVGDPYDTDLPREVELQARRVNHLEGQIETEGTDALAWYAPFHFYGDGIWGIYVTLSGMEYLVRKVFSSAVVAGPRQSRLDGSGTGSVQKAPGADALRRLAFGFLFYHEYFHFQTEIAACVPEVGRWQAGSPCYSRYSCNVYEKPVHPDEPLEEALANASALASLRSTFRRRPFVQMGGLSWEALLESAVVDFMNRQPRGYRSYDDFARAGLKKGVRRLGLEICAGAPTATGPPPLELMFGLRSADVGFGDVPVRFVD